MFAHAGTTCRAPQGGDFISYAIQPEFAEGRAALRVALTFRFESRSAINLVLPSEWQGTTLLYKSIRNLKASSPATMTDSSSASRRRISFQRGTAVSVEYVFEPDEAGAGEGVSFAPRLSQSFFVLTGRNFLVYPEIREHERIPVFLEWKNFPNGWVLADSLGANETCQHADDLVQLSNGLFVGGDFRVTTATPAGLQLRVAIRGHWSFSDERLTEVAAKIIAAEREFWEDRSPAHYLVVLAPLKALAGEYAGTAVDGGLLMLMSPGTEFSFDVQFLLAHETFHTWNPVQLGELGSSNPYWFTEGFTDYYAREILLHASLITLRQYVDDINRVYSEYARSPAIGFTEKLAQSKYFEDPSAERLPYLQGTLLALRWNAMTQQQSPRRQSLDDAMRTLRRNAKESDRVLSDENLAAFFSRYAGPTAVSDVRDYIALGHPLPLPAGALGNCFELRKKTFFTFAAGFDIDTMYRSRVIRGVNETSEAYKAGLRDGQAVLGSSTINPNDPNQQIEITVAGAGGSQTVRYYPRGSATEVDQYEPVSSSDNPHCTSDADAGGFRSAN